MKTVSSGVAAITAALVLTACGASKPASPAATPPTTAAKPSAAAPAGPLKPGAARTFTYPDQTFRVTVYHYKQPLRTDVPPDQRGYVYGGADVRFCTITATNIPKVSWVPWGVDFADDTSADSAGSVQLTV